MDRLKDALRMEKIARLKSLAQDVAPESMFYRCERCSDMGVIKFDVPPDDRRHAKLYACDNPDCPTVRDRTHERFEKLKTLYEIDMDIETYQSYTFATWRAQSAEMLKGKRIPLAMALFLARNPFREFCMSDMLKAFNIRIDSEVWEGDQQRLTFTPAEGEAPMTINNSIGNWLVFEGEYGTGKTGLALAILRALPHDTSHLYIHLPKFLELFQKTYSYDDEEERAKMQERLTRPLLDADVLLVDEMNVAVAANGREGGAASEDKTRIVLNYIIQPRWLAKDRKPTIITTNKPPEEFERHWDRRITSRVFERAHWMRFQGKPLRRRNAPN